VLFEAPIPLVGGPYTLEALIYGAVSGLAIVLTIAIFAILQAGADIHDLLPLVPRPFYRAGAVVALALALVPQTTATFHRIREARSLDAHERSWARAAGIVLPVLLTSLERSLQYAESLDARGFGSRARTRFRPLQWTVADSAVIAGALLALASVALAPAVGYNPYLDLLPPIPSFASVVGVLCLGMPLSITSMRPRVATRPA
jgi:energy-coupling factor transport system permease protein